MNLERAFECCKLALCHVKADFQAHERVDREVAP